MINLIATIIGVVIIIITIILSIYARKDRINKFTQRKLVMMNLAKELKFTFEFNEDYLPKQALKENVSKNRVMDKLYGNYKGYSIQILDMVDVFGGGGGVHRIVLSTEIIINGNSKKLKGNSEIDFPSLDKIKEVISKGN